MCSHPISVAPSSSKFSYSRIRILEGHIISVATLCELQLGPGLNFQLIFHVSFRRLRHHSGCLGGPLSFYRCPGLGIASIFFFSICPLVCVYSLGPSDLVSLCLTIAVVTVTLNHGHLLPEHLVLCLPSQCHHMPQIIMPHFPWQEDDHCTHQVCE